MVSYLAFSLSLFPPLEYLLKLLLLKLATLLRLLLTLTLLPLTLFPSLVSFLILSSSYLSPQAGGYAPMLAVLSVVVPGWTARVVLGLVTDAYVSLSSHVSALQIED